jgi:hypothetical protein
MRQGFFAFCADDNFPLTSSDAKRRA